MREMRIARLMYMFLGITVCCFLLSFSSTNVYARYTKIGVASSQSYVKKRDKRPVIIFVGDSRAMQCTFPGGNPSSRKNYCFCWVNGGNVNVIGKKGKLTPYVKRMIRRYKQKCVVVLNLGVNGNSNPKHNAKRIIKIYRQWMKQYPKVRFFVVSVNPTILKRGPYSNKKVIALNKRLKKEFDPEGIYIDSY